ncbi:filamentous hemagglutinin N-terminal domain-containing protein [Nostoc sp. C117]|uniref:two-partner secretion domain-containing protein n=1 Tax=Nostoc sp. C117 TaxID=3349875 RepID=UPI00370D4E40
MRIVPFLLILTTGFFTSGMLLPATAQVTSDGTTNTQVNQSGNNFNILNGINKGNNLFHSFSNFSVPTGGSATFDLINTPNITTIFSRVTAGNVSNIDGLISTLNSSNPVSLFLMNPAGIVFGANARLDIGGSFLGTTANSIKFSDGTEFSAVNPTATPLLTISVPMGLQMGQTPGIITVQNTGHRLLIQQSSPVQMGTTPLGLQVAPGQTLALVGGDIVLDGGILSAPSGHLELSSAKAGTVNLTTTSPDWNLDYSTLTQYGDIRFSRQALANASGAPSGSIHLQGRNIRVNDGSVALLINEGNQVSGDITVNASEFLEVSGIGTYGFARSMLFTDTTKGAGGNLVITAPQVLVQDGAEAYTRTLGSGRAGNISVAADGIQIVGFSPLNISNNSDIGSETDGAGRGGDVQLTTQQLSIQRGGQLTNATFGAGTTGNSTINATDFIELSGYIPNPSGTSGFLGATSFNRGNVGQVTINTSTLRVLDSGSLSTNTFGQGNAGILQINASEQIIVSGNASGVPSRIGSGAPKQSAAFLKSVGLSGLPTGNSGDLVINTPSLQITDGGLVRVANQGVGNAGNLYINADTIALDRSGTISATTNSGKGGGINLQSNALILRHGSNIIATAGGTGNGGNITINSPIILGLENSDIVANAFQGKGGNINITTQGIFGLKYSNQLTPESDITASSEFGINGTVDINNFGVDSSSGLVELPVNLTDSSQQIATGCSNNTGSSFVATGRGGIPQNPTQEVRSDRTWSDVRDISAYRNTQTVQAQIPKSLEVLVPATGWRRNADGKIEIFADKSPPRVQQALTCAAVTQN